MSESEQEIVDPELLKQSMAKPLEELNAIYNDKINVKLTPSEFASQAVLCLSV